MQNGVYLFTWVFFVDLLLLIIVINCLLASLEHISNYIINKFKMDMSKFLDDSFDAKEWINASFTAQRDSSVGKDQHASTIVMKLQKFIQEVNGIIEETSQQALLNLPKVMREINAVKQEAGLLKEQMSAVKRDIQKVEHETSQSMQMLLKLDTIKERMTDASDALKEADNWTTLSADVEDVFLTQDLQAMTNKLVGMQQSLQMLVDTPDYTARRLYLEGLKNQLEAHLSTQIVSAFISQSVEAAVTYVNIFRMIDRLPQLHVYYHKSHKKQLLELWKATIETNPDDTVVEWFTEYLDLLLSTWHSQVKWCRQVFTEPLPLVCDLLTDTLTSLDPSLTSLVAPLICDSTQPLDILISLKQVSERFARSLENATEAHPESCGGVAHVTRLYDAVYAPYRFYISRYRTYEEETLQRDLDRIKLDHAEIVDTVRLLGESTDKLFHAAKMAGERCVKLTEGFGYLHLVDAYKTYFTAYSREFHRVLVNVREKCKPGTFYLEEDDWTNFQHSLRIIQTAGELIMHVEELEDLVVSGILSTVGKLNSVSPRSPDHRATKPAFDAKAALLLSDKDDRRSLGLVMSKFDEGDTPSLFSEIKRTMYRISEAVHQLAFDVAFTQLNNYLCGISQLEIWTSESAGGALTSDLPMFSLSPQEYITKIGQYLMTLPQQLEPFTMEENPSVVVALKHGKLPYTDQQELPDHIAALWLESIARGTMHVYCEEILRIEHLSTHATKQLVVDIEYLCNVLDDLGLHSSTALNDITSLLKVHPDSYAETAAKLPLRLVQSVAAIRDIES